MTLEELRAGPVVAVDVNAGHLDAAVIAADGNVVGAPFTVPLELAPGPSGAAHRAILTIARWLGTVYVREVVDASLL